MTHAARILATKSNLTATTTHFGSLAQVVANQPPNQQLVLQDLGNSRGSVVENTQQVLTEQTVHQHRLQNSVNGVIADTSAFSAGVEKCRIATMQILNSARAQGLRVTLGGGSVFAPTRDKTQLAVGYNHLLASVGSAMDTFDEKMAAKIKGYSAKLAQSAPTSSATNRPTTLLNTSGFGAVSGTPAQEEDKKPKPFTFSASAEPNTARGDKLNAAQFPNADPADPYAPTSVKLKAGGDTTFNLGVGDNGRLDVLGGGVDHTFRSHRDGTPTGTLGFAYEPDTASVQWTGPGDDFRASGAYDIAKHTIKGSVGGDTGNTSIDATVQYDAETNHFESVEAKVKFKI